MYSRLIEIKQSTFLYTTNMEWGGGGGEAGRRGEGGGRGVAVPTMGSKKLESMQQLSSFIL